MNKKIIPLSAQIENRVSLNLRNTVAVSRDSVIRGITVHFHKMFWSQHFPNNFYNIFFYYTFNVIYFSKLIVMFNFYCGFKCTRFSFIFSFLCCYMISLVV